MASHRFQLTAVGVLAISSVLAAALGWRWLVTSPDPAQAADVFLRQDGRDVGVFSEETARQRGSELAGFEIAAVAHIPAGLVPRSVKVQTETPTGADFRAVKLIYEPADSSRASHETLIVEQFARAPRTHVSDVDEWSVQVAARGTVGVTTFTRLKGLQVTIFALLGQSQRGINVTVINLDPAEATPLIDSLANGLQ
jgi:hypothetical protein